MYWKSWIFWHEQWKGKYFFLLFFPSSLHVPFFLGLLLSHLIQFHDVHSDHLLHVELLWSLVRNDSSSLVQEAELIQVKLLSLAVGVLQEAQWQPPLHLEINVWTRLVPNSKLNIHVSKLTFTLRNCINGVTHAFLPPKKYPYECNQTNIFLI